MAHIIVAGAASSIKVLVEMLSERMPRNWCLRAPTTGVRHVPWDSFSRRGCKLLTGMETELGGK